MDNRYKLYQVAQKSGGPCEVCGWKDGDGVVTCFYSPELGAVTHENSERKAERQMSAAQASLYALGEALVYDSKEGREQHFQETKSRNEDTFAKFTPSDFLGTSPYYSPDRQPMTMEEVIERDRKRIFGKPCADDPEYEGWVRGGTWQFHMIHVYEPHPRCGGKKVFVAPYHFRCSKCGTEVKLWEFGIDYDIG